MKNKNILNIVFIFLFILNLIFSCVIYSRFIRYEEVFNFSKTTLEFYKKNHKYVDGKIYKIINHTANLPNGYRSYIVKTVHIKERDILEEDFVFEIDVPENRSTFFAGKFSEKVSTPKFLTVINVDHEEKTLLFNNLESLLHYCKK